MIADFWPVNEITIIYSTIIIHDYILLTSLLMWTTTCDSPYKENCFQSVTSHTSSPAFQMLPWLCYVWIILTLLHSTFLGQAHCFVSKVWALEWRVEGRQQCWPEKQRVKASLKSTVLIGLSHCIQSCIIFCISWWVIGSLITFLKICLDFFLQPSYLKWPSLLTDLKWRSMNKKN